MPLSEGVTTRSELEPMIPPSKAAPDESHLANESQSNEFDSTNDSAHAQPMNDLPQSQHENAGTPSQCQPIWQNTQARALNARKYQTTQPCFPIVLQSNASR